MRFNRHLLAPGLLFAVLTVVSSCGESDERKVARAEDRFHTLFKESKFFDIYQQASPTLQSVKTKEEFVAQLREARERVSEIEVIEKKDSYVPPRSKSYFFGPPRFVVDFYLLKGKSSSCLELLGWIIEGGEAKLLHYSCGPVSD